MKYVSYCHFLANFCQNHFFQSNLSSCKQYNFAFAFKINAKCKKFLHLHCHIDAKKLICILHYYIDAKKFICIDFCILHHAKSFLHVPISGPKCQSWIVNDPLRGGPQNGSHNFRFNSKVHNSCAYLSSYNITGSLMHA